MGERYGRGPSVVLDQLELEIDGITPLTEEERIERWLAEQDQATPQVLAATLTLRDSMNRADRVERFAELLAFQEPFQSEHGWLIPGGAEAVWLYAEAERSFIEGLFLATLLCAHAACERVLAGCLLSYEDELEKDWKRWGLGPLARAAFERGLIDDEMKQNLLQVTEQRKVSAHYKPPLDPMSVSMRAYGASVPEEDSDEELINEVLRRDALTSLKAATELLRGDQGFTRVRIW